MKNKKNKIKHRSEENEEDKRIMEIMWKLGSGFKEDKKITNKQK